MQRALLLPILLYYSAFYVLIKKYTFKVCLFDNNVYLLYLYLLKLNHKCKMPRSKVHLNPFLWEYSHSTNTINYNNNSINNESTSINDFESNVFIGRASMNDKGASISSGPCQHFVCWCMCFIQQIWIKYLPLIKTHHQQWLLVINRKRRRKIRWICILGQPWVEDCRGHNEFDCICSTQIQYALCWKTWAFLVSVYHAKNTPFLIIINN